MCLKYEDALSQRFFANLHYLFITAVGSEKQTACLDPLNFLQQLTGCNKDGIVTQTVVMTRLLQKTPQENQDYTQKGENRNEQGFVKKHQNIRIRKTAYNP